MWDCEDFLFTWCARTPTSKSSNIVPTSELLKGIALLEDVKVSSVDKKAVSARQYRYFPKDNLSHDTKIRFQELFAIRERYSIEDIVPYLSDLYGNPGQPKSLVALMLQYCNNVDNMYQHK